MAQGTEVAGFTPSHVADPLKLLLIEMGVQDSPLSVDSKTAFWAGSQLL
jgi:hypothetical protein